MMTTAFRVLMGLVFLGSLFISCKQENNNDSPVEELDNSSNIEKKKNTEAYDFENPSKTLFLSYKLLEISGMSYDFETNSILAINDEKGVIYKLDTAEAAIKEELKFGKNGDYEGITIMEDTLVVLKHNGDLYFTDRGNTATRIVETILSSKNDLEGLFYQASTKRLLLAAKGQTLKEKKSKKRKAIYAFDLEKQAIDEEAFVIIQDSILENHVKRNFSNLSKSKRKKLSKRIADFSPSGIAIHPLNEKIYILSAKGSSLIVFNKEKELEEVKFFKTSKIPQPEGICFGPKGELFISTEGKGLKAKIFRFQPL